jgi:predicted lipoprotein with Yx(FWY)xxD motif
MTRDRTFRKAWPALFAVAALALAACSGGAAASTAPAVAATPTAAASMAPTDSTAPSQAAVVYEIKVGTGTVGSYLTGEDGKTLYTFKPDEAAAGKSTCNGDCATNWPPFTLDAGETASAGTGVSGTIASITRDDGSKQVTYKGKPLYYFKGDSAAGDTNGQGKAGNWFVAAP